MDIAKPTPRRRRGLIRTALVAVGAAMLLTVSASAAFAAVTVSPNPVAPGGTITITPDSACVGSVTTSDQWVLLSSSGALVGGPVAISSGVTMLVPNTPGSYQLQVYSPGSFAACLAGVVVATTTGTALLEPLPVAALATLCLVTGALIVRSRRRRSILPAGS